MTLKSISFMSENFSSNNMEIDEYNTNTEEIDYKNLIYRLKEIKEIISFLEKTIFK